MICNVILTRTDKKEVVEKSVRSYRHGKKRKEKEKKGRRSINQNKKED
jgi:hypothetical protein